MINNAGETSEEIMDSSEFKDIPDYEGLYQVNRKGVIWSLPRTVVYVRNGVETTSRTAGKIMTPVHVRSIPTVTLLKDGRKRQIAINSIVAQVFIGPRPPGTCPCHKDNDLSNYHADNLYYGVPSFEPTPESSEPVGKYGFLPSQISPDGAEKEEFRDIPGWEGYAQVSNFGRVRTLSRGVARTLPTGTVVVTRYKERILAPTIVNGYYALTLSNEGRKWSVAIHILVALAFLGPKPQGMEVCHNDGNPLNIHVSNLRYDTHSGNLLDKRLHGTDNRGERHPLSVLTEAQVRQVWSLRHKGLMPSEIARMLQDTVLKDLRRPYLTVLKILRGEAWKHLIRDIDIPFIWK